MTSRSLVQSVLLGGCLGLGWSLLTPASYEATVSVYFPTTNPQLLSRLTEALRVTPDSDFALGVAPPATSDLSNLASTILKSQSAAEYALTKAGESSTIRRWSDPLEEFRKRLTVTETGPGTLTLKLLARSAESARIKQQSLLDYYSEYIKKTPLTRVRQAREMLEERLAKTTTTLRKLEEQMSRSSSRELRALGDSAIKANPKLMTQLWLRRLEEDQQGREVLNKMQKIRGSTSTASLPEDAWLADWSKDQKGKAARPSHAFSNVTVRRQDLGKRAALERDYYEALLRHRAFVLQHSFLLTLDQLENTTYNVVDPIRIRSRRPNPWLWTLLGCALGLILSFASGLIRPKSRKN